MTQDLDYYDFKVTQVEGRYVTNTHITDYLRQLNASFHLGSLGTSVQGKPIYGLTIGSGPKRILMWSQMHGNESTTTKAVLDLINYLKLELGESKNILQHLTLKIIPILNPDGAEAYTRVNANSIDLNRDAQDCSQPESKNLKAIYKDFKPDYCFNLHDQRTIFNVGETEKPATVSFLAPAFDEDRSISDSRLTSMQIIAAMNKKLQGEIPGQVGRYDDGFNANCVGDAFQMLGTPTVLFEAGHFKSDYQREITRKYIFSAILEALKCIGEQKLKRFTYEDYMVIPENGKMYCDIRIINANILDTSLAPESTAHIIFQEKLEGGHVLFLPRIEEKEFIGQSLFGHETKDATDLNDRLWLEKCGVLSLFS